MQFLVLDFG